MISDSKNSHNETWVRAQRMAFWDRNKLTLPQWQKAVKTNDLKVIWQSVSFMRAADLIELLGYKAFVKSWPVWSPQFERSGKVIILNAIWSDAIAGDIAIPVDSRLLAFHPRKLDTLRLLTKLDGTDSIYQVAKKLGRNYRRVHDDVHDFAANGFIRLVAKVQNGRHVEIPQVLGIHFKKE